jgi:hypothetical protein
MREIVLDYQRIRHNEGYLVHLVPRDGEGSYIAI